MSNIGESLRARIPPNISPRQLATSWLDQSNKQGMATSEVEALIRLLLANNSRGLRFFFEKRERATVLLAAIGIPSSEWPEMLERASKELQAVGQPRFQMVIDVTPAREDRGFLEHLFPAIRQQLLTGQLRPAALLLTQAQFEFLPRSFDALHDWLRVERVASTAEAPMRLAALAGDEALVVAFTRYHDYERWLAVWPTKSSEGAIRLNLEPADGLERFAHSGTLPPLLEVPEPLENFLVLSSGAQPEVSLPDDITKQRRLMADLSDPEGQSNLPSSGLERLALAKALGIRAAPTARDRIESELRLLSERLSLVPLNATAEELEVLRGRARWRSVPETLLRVGDTLHLLNPQQPRLGLKHSRLKSEEIQPVVPAMERLTQELESWTEDDWNDDPLLVHALKRLDPEGNEVGAFIHARACLLWGEPAMKPISSPVEWRDGLQRLLAADVPCAGLLAEAPSGWGGKCVLPEADLAVWDTLLMQAWAGEKPPYVLRGRIRGGLGWLERDTHVRHLIQTGNPTKRKEEMSKLILYAHGKEIETLISFPPSWEHCPLVNCSPRKYVADGDRYYRQYADDRYYAGPYVRFTGVPQLWVMDLTSRERRGLWAELFEASPGLRGAPTKSAALTERLNAFVQKKPALKLEHDKEAHREVVSPFHENPEAIAADPLFGRLISLPEQAVLNEFDSISERSADVSVSAELWTEADRVLGMAWMALRRAAASVDASRLPNGRVLLPVGSSLVAEIWIRRHQSRVAQKEPVRAGLYTTLIDGKESDGQGGQIRYFQRPDSLHLWLPTHQAESRWSNYQPVSTVWGLKVPRGIRLDGHGWRADITFLTSPWLSGSEAPAMIPPAGALIQDRLNSEDDY